MNCDEFVELVTAFLEGALDEATEQRFIEHISECDGCDVYLDQFRRTIQVAGELQPETIPPEIRRTVLDAFRDWHR
ncbi:anti-sigma factor [Nocardia sp. BMG51109]|uniref:anti-sigma factor family protein n=1 Tax=Nocardia sp. BMG51109 TaxID=1056816 RepID=UPI0004658FFB|nr:zf-HC2 domain-containing protein [Nocardia sp. BMG51109]